MMNLLFEARSVARAVALFTAVVLLGGCATTHRTGSAAPAAASIGAEVPLLLAAADRARSKGDLENAQSAYETILVTVPDHTEALLGLAETQLQRSVPDAALATFKKVTESASLPRALQGQGLALALLQRADEAVAQLSLAVAQDPTLWRSWAALGCLNDQRSDWKAAEDAYTRALALAPQSAEIYNNFGVSFLLQRRYDDARRNFLLALEHDPALASAQANLRLAYAWAGDYSKALANAAPSEQAHVLNNVGYVAMERGDYDTAETLLSEAVRRSPSFYKRANDNLGELRRRTHQTPKVVTQ